MKIISKLALPAILLRMSLTIVAAQAPIQEPIYGTQEWQQVGRAFMSGLYPHAGERSVVYQLPPDVAREIVELAKPKEEYGFIKNFTNKPIVFIELSFRGESTLDYVLLYKMRRLDPRYQIHIIEPVEKSLKDICLLDFDYWILGACRSSWRNPPSQNLYDIHISLNNESEKTVKNVHCFDLMNLSIYEDGQRIRIKVTAPGRDPADYYSEQIELNEHC